MSLPRSPWILLSVSLLLTTSFVVWTLLVSYVPRLQAFDTETALTFQRLAEGHHARRAVMIGATHTGGVPAMIALALVGAVWQWRRNDAALAGCWIAIVASGGLVDVVLKKSINRDRPPAEWRDIAVTENNESYPSGHSMGSVIGYGMVGFAVAPLWRRRIAKIMLIVLLATLVGLIGFSRIYLRAHWFSDVIGGFAIGGAWLVFGLAWVLYLRAGSVSDGGPNHLS